MKKFLTVFALLTAAMGFSLTAQAAFVNDIDYDNNIISVKGQMSGTQMNKTVFVAVKNPQDEEIKLDGSQYLIALNTDGNGNFESKFQIEPADVSDDYMYTLCVTSYDGTPYEEEFYFCSGDELMPVIDKIAAAAEGGEVSSLIEENKDILGFIYNTYSAVSSSAKSDICSGLAGYSEFADVESFNKAYYDLYIPQAVNSAQDGQEAAEILSQYEKYSGISELLIYPEFEKLGKLQTNVYNYMTKKQDKNCKEMGVTFTEGAVLQLLSVTENSSQAEMLLKKYKDIIGLDLSKAEALKEPGKVYSELSGKTFVSIKELQDRINTLADNVLEPPKNPGSSGGGGGSSSGSGGGGFNASLTNDQEEIKKPDSVPEKKYFNDLENAPWAESAINSLYEKNIVSGYPDDTFRPSAAMTREEFAVLAVKAFGLLDENAECDFSDVSKSDWYYSYVASLYDKGLISGVGEGMFGSGDRIKRQDAAVMLANIIEYKELELAEARTYSGFADEDDIAEYAKESVRVLYEANVINGSDDGCFYPQKNITRAECCVMINKMPGIN